MSLRCLCHKLESAGQNRPNRSRRTRIDSRPSGPTVTYSSVNPPNFGLGSWFWYQNEEKCSEKTNNRLSGRLTLNFNSQIARTRIKNSDFYILRCPSPKSGRMGLFFFLDKFRTIWPVISKDELDPSRENATRDILIWEVWHILTLSHFQLQFLRAEEIFWRGFCYEIEE